MPEVRSVIFCDDVRREDNGKLILVGVYTGFLGIPSFPWSGVLHTVLLIENVESEHEFMITVGTASGAKFLEMQATISHVPGMIRHTAYIPLPPVPVTLSSPDEIQLRTSVDGGASTVVGILPVQVPIDAKEA